MIVITQLSMKLEGLGGWRIERLMAGKQETPRIFKKKSTQLTNGTQKNWKIDRPISRNKKRKTLMFKN